MFVNTSRITGFKIKAKDGGIGHVSDFLVNDEYWTVSYLVADTGSWISGRKVLVPTRELEEPDPGEEVFPVNLTRIQIKESPGIDFDKPVSMQKQYELYTYYGWKEHAFIGAPGPLKYEPPSPKNVDQSSGNPHLRSLKELVGYKIISEDEKIGKIEDFIIDDDRWLCRYLVADIGGFLQDRKILISPAWIRKIVWKEENVYLTLSRDNIKSSPEYNEKETVTREYEKRLYQHFDIPGYWSQE